MEIKLPAILESTKLDGSNYLQWCNTIRVYLSAVGLEDHLSEDPPRDDPALFNLWKMEDAQIVNLMKKTLQPDIALVCGCSDRNSSKQIWDYVRSMYARDRSKLYDLWANITKLKQKNESLTKYFAAFCALKYELEEALPVGDDAEGSEMKKQREMLLSFSFLMGLRAEFEPAIRGILREKEMPCLYEVYGRVAMHDVWQCGECGSQRHTHRLRPAGDAGAVIAVGVGAFLAVAGVFFTIIKIAK